MLKSLYAKRVLMVRPTSFFFNDSTASDNTFMKKLKIPKSESTRLAQVEFDFMRAELETLGV